MTAVDTTVAVAALAAWHSDHHPARDAAAEAAIPAHARLETYSVLTRMPPPHRLGAHVAGEALGLLFPPKQTLVPSAELSQRMVERCAAVGIAGGAVYDALVGLTAADAGMTLLTLDLRAVETYRRLGIAFELLA